MQVLVMDGDKIIGKGTVICCDNNGFLWCRDRHKSSLFCVNPKTKRLRAPGKLGCDLDYEVRINDDQRKE